MSDPKDLGGCKPNVNEFLTWPYSALLQSQKSFKMFRAIVFKDRLGTHIHACMQKLPKHNPFGGVTTVTLEVSAKYSDDDLVTVFQA